MKVRYLSGSQKGAEAELPETEAQNLVATGFAEPAELAPAPPAAATAAAPEGSKAGKKTGGKKGTKAAK